jgi:hypothetical protein
MGSTDAISPALSLPQSGPLRTFKVLQRTQEAEAVDSLSCDHFGWFPARILDHSTNNFRMPKQIVNTSDFPSSTKKHVVTSQQFAQ